MDETGKYFANTKIASCEHQNEEPCRMGIQNVSVNMLRVRMVFAKREISNLRFIVSY